MQNYAKIQAKDQTDAKFSGIAVPFVALAATSVENGSASSVTSLNPNTTVVEIAAITSPVGIKWTTSQATSVVTAVAGANFDNIVPTGTVRQFVVPRNTQAGLYYNANQSPSIVGLNVREGLYSAIAMKGVSVGSVLLTQY